MRIALVSFLICLTVPVRAADCPKFEKAAEIRVEDGVAEIVDDWDDGRRLAFTDSEGARLGLVDLAEPRRPRLSGFVPLPGAPTSVAVVDATALVTTGGDESALVVVDLEAGRTVRQIPLPGQPDAVSVDQERRYAVVVVENERDENVDGGRMPQLPSGSLVIVDLTGDPGEWVSRSVDLSGIARRFPEDAEPEFVSISDEGLAAVTLQENNHVVIVDIATGEVVADWEAGMSVHEADLTTDGVVSFSDTLTARREPDGITWTDDGLLVIANEGDYDDPEHGGSGGRDVSIHRVDGSLVWESGADLELAAVEHGRYDDATSEKRGVEPEGVLATAWGDCELLFVGLEKGSGVVVYSIADPAAPRRLQFLETGKKPEGLLAVPSRGLFVTANEGDGSLSVFIAVAQEPADR